MEEEKAMLASQNNQTKRERQKYLTYKVPGGHICSMNGLIREEAAEDPGEGERPTREERCEIARSGWEEGRRMEKGGGERTIRWIGGNCRRVDRVSKGEPWPRFTSQTQKILNRDTQRDKEDEEEIVGS